jgi:hypothetical protein
MNPSPIPVVVVCQQAGGCPAASNFLLRRQKKVTKEKATRWSGTLRFATGTLRCSAKAGSRSNSPSAQTIASPDPLLPALLGPARRVGRNTNTNTNTNSGRRGRAKRVLAGARLRTRTRFWSHHPSGCAEERRSRRIRTGDCLSVASSSPAPAGPSTAGCPRSASEGGRRQQGRLFFAYFLLATQKKVSCRRATPGQQTHANNKRPIKHAAEAQPSPTDTQ